MSKLQAITDGRKLRWLAVKYFFEYDKTYKYITKYDKVKPYLLKQDGYKLQYVSGCFYPYLFKVSK